MAFAMLQGGGRKYWKKVGCTQEEIDIKVRFSEKTRTGLVSLTAVAVGVAQCLSIDPATDVVRFSTRRTGLALLNAATMIVTWGLDTYESPPPQIPSDPYYVTKTIGPLAFFTKQALCIQTIHILLSLAAEASLSTPRPALGLATLVHATATPVAVISVSLTVLFLKLNWFEANWRKECLDPWLERGVWLRVVSLGAHTLGCPVALVDLLFVKRRLLANDMTHEFLTSATFLFFYSIFYVTLTLVNSKLNGGYFPYPFMRAIKTPLHWVIFTAVVFFLVAGIILPLVLAIKALARYAAFSSSSSVS